MKRHFDIRNVKFHSLNDEDPRDVVPLPLWFEAGGILLFMIAIIVASWVDNAPRVDYEYPDCAPHAEECWKEWYLGQGKEW